MTTPIYKVQSGESLSKIAQKLLGDKDRWKELAFINGLSHPYLIFPGQLIELPEKKNEPLVIEVKGERPESTKSAALPAPKRPATALLVLAAAAAFLLLKK